MTVHWPSIEHVMLDMDGTILDLAFDNHFWGEVVPARYAERKGISFEAAAAELKPHFDSLRGTLPWYSLTHWSALTGLDLGKLKHDVRHRSGPLPGAPEFLRAVKASGRSLWLVTNADPHALDIKQGHSNLAQYFDRLVSSHDFDAPKEDPQFWPRLAARFPFDKARSLYVDDNASVLAAARDYGIGQIVAIRHPDSTRPSRDVPGFKSVERLADLLPLG